MHADNIQTQAATIEALPKWYLVQQEGAAVHKVELPDTGRAVGALYSLAMSEARDNLSNHMDRLLPGAKLGSGAEVLPAEVLDVNRWV